MNDQVREPKPMPAALTNYSASLFMALFLLVMGGTGARLTMAAVAGSADVSVITDPFPEMQDPSKCHGRHCGGDHDAKPGSVVLDCSGRRAGAAHTLREAVRRVPVNGEILVLGAPQGRTCASDGTIIDKPLTIRPHGAIGTGYIEGTVPPPVTNAPVARFSSVEAMPGRASVLIRINKLGERLLGESAGLTERSPFEFDNKEKHNAAQRIVDEKRTLLRAADQADQNAPSDASDELRQELRQKLQAAREAYDDSVVLLRGEPIRKICSLEQDIRAFQQRSMELARLAQRAQDRSALLAVRLGSAELDQRAADLLRRLEATSATNADGQTVCDIDAPSRVTAQAYIKQVRETAALLNAGSTTLGTEVSAELSDGDRERYGSCLDVRLPTGDTLTVIGINFIVRSGKSPCVRVQAGTVVFKRTRIDSRGTEWAFDVRESGRLVLEDSRIETDGGGVSARRATVDVLRTEIQLERGRRGIGAALTGTDGAITDLSVIGGEVGLLVSSGSRGLVLDRPVISGSGVGILAVGASGQGTITARNSSIQRAIIGTWVRNNANAEFLGGSITQSQRVGFVVSGSTAVIRGFSRIDGAVNGVIVMPSGKPTLVAERLTPPSPCYGNSNDGYGGSADGKNCDDVIPPYPCPPKKSGETTPCNQFGIDELNRIGLAEGWASDAFVPGTVEIDKNTIRSMNGHVVRIDGDENAQAVLLTDNILDCPKGWKCVSESSSWSRKIEKRGNRCTNQHWFSRCND